MSFLGMDIGYGELLIILIVALLVVGPEKLPSYARKASRVVRSFQKMTTDLNGQISKAINLEDEEDGKASDFKKDLIEVKKSLEKDVAELKATLDDQTKVIAETMGSGTKDAVASIEKNAKEISDTLNMNTEEPKIALSAKAKAVSETMESNVKDTATNLRKNAKEVTEAVDPVSDAEIIPGKERLVSKTVSTPHPKPIGKDDSN